MRAQRVREGESRVEMQSAKWTAEFFKITVLDRIVVFCQGLLFCPKVRCAPEMVMADLQAGLQKSGVAVSGIGRTPAARRSAERGGQTEVGKIFFSRL